MERGFEGLKGNTLFRFSGEISDERSVLKKKSIITKFFCFFFADYAKKEATNGVIV